MKNRILTFIIGVLVGAILTILGFLIFSRSNPNQNEKMPFDRNMYPGYGQMGEPPVKPNENMEINKFE